MITLCIKNTNSFKIKVKTPALTHSYQKPKNVKNLKNVKFTFLIKIYFFKIVENKRLKKRP